MGDKITLDLVRHIAHLARLKLAPAEEAKFTEDFIAILGYIEILGELDTSKVAETAQVTGLTNVMFPDEAEVASCSGDELLELTENELRDRQIVVKKVF